MISSAYVISSLAAPDDDYLSMLASVGASIGFNNLAKMEKIFDGASNIWIRKIDLDAAGYEESDLAKIKKMLQKPARTIVMIDYDEGDSAATIVLKLVFEISLRWPIVFDNCHDRVYSAAELPELMKSGTF